MPFPTSLTSFPAWGAVLAALDAPLFEYNGARKIVTNLLWQPSSPPWVTLEQLGRIGYERPKSKIQALHRMYLNRLEAARVRDMMKKREDQAYSAITLSTIAGEKDRRSMGHCIQNITLSLTPKRTEVTVVYRSTELIKKFSADLAFIPMILECHLDLKRIDRVSFFFANAFLSGVFFPTLMCFVDPIEWLEHLRVKEPQLFIVATRFLRRSVQTEAQDFPFAPEKHQHNIAWKNFRHRMPEIRRYLKRHLADRAEPKINRRATC